MVKYTGRFRAPIALGAFLLLAACGGDKNNADSALAADSALNNDLAMAGSDTAAQPALRDVPATKAKTTPTKTTPRTTTKTTTTTTTTKTTPSGNTSTKGTGGGGAVKTIPSGTTLALQAKSEVCTNTSKVGDRFTAATTADVVGENGAVIPAGATVIMRVTQLKRSENVKDKIIMAFEVQSIRFGGKTYPISGNLTEVAIDRVRNQPKSADVKKVIGGAAIGAIAGQILGKNTKSTVIGAAAGAAAGAGAAAATANYEGCIRSGSGITLVLSQPLQIIASADRTIESVHHRKVA
jgi:hypothetical protein